MATLIFHNIHFWPLSPYPSRYNTCIYCTYFYTWFMKDWKCTSKWGWGKKKIKENKPISTVIPCEISIGTIKLLVGSISLWGNLLFIATYMGGGHDFWYRVIQWWGVSTTFLESLEDFYSHWLSYSSWIFQSKHGS